MANDDDKYEIHHLAKRKYIAPKKTAKTDFKAVPRVLRVAERYICGICRNKYFSFDEAKICLAKCSPGFIASHGVEEVVLPTRTTYVCGLCSQPYTTVESANKCFERCKADILAGQFKGAGTSSTTTTSQTTSTEKPPSAPVAKPVASPSTAANKAPIAAKSEKPQSTSDAGTPDLSARTIILNVPTNGRKKGQKSFYRDGARYLCSVCKAKFFTKEEVEACFLKHPEIP